MIFEFAISKKPLRFLPRIKQLLITIKINASFLKGKLFGKFIAMRDIDRDELLLVCFEKVNCLIKENESNSEFLKFFRLNLNFL